MATRRSNRNKRIRQRKRHEHRPHPRQQYSPLSRGLLVPTPTPFGVLQTVLAEQVR
jgi:hypothetical protein